ncbi:MAG: Cof-type HAD-IIB family hydrolase [Gordonia sp. (in: high G+C Gram-positive bacteria)]|uniref:Cof-type HAD-IIB family hydrolase n=1 Tax=Gordonia sp. (in: high G+C Gram-positive bacteria) TaxID=84139 RepID=UPI0039E36A6A
MTDLKMVVADMDGTLLRDDGTVPDSFWPLLDEMRERGIVFVPASGRQYYTLQKLFERSPEGLSYIAENGNLVAHDGRLEAVGTVDQSVTDEVVSTVRAAYEHGRDLGLVVCGVAGGYVERHDRPFVDECDKYYVRLDRIDDLDEIDDQILKLAVYDFEDAETAAGRYFAELADRTQVVVSGRNWIDIMSPGVDKGVGVRALQSDLGISPAQTVVFGDYLNDLQMLDAADRSYAMANAHPEVRARATHLAPSNDDEGVVQVLRRLLSGG